MASKLTLFHGVLGSLVRSETLPDRKRIAEDIAKDARGLAPVLTGEYRGGIDVEVSGTVVRVVDNDDEAIHKEYGTSDTPAHAALTRAASTYGRYSGTRPR